jgi:hypothetical protein
MERRLAAILAADVKGYGHLTELNEEASTATLRMYRAIRGTSSAARETRAGDVR